MNCKIIHQKSSGVYLGYLIHNTGICAQGYNVHEVKEKLKRFSELYLNKNPILWTE